jgi:hypothetical protein
MRVPGYINLEKYAHFRTLDISQKYSKLDLGMQVKKEKEKSTQ